jgi:hypothetical protein
VKLPSEDPVPNITCTGASKPSPLIVTCVPPSFGPDAGRDREDGRLQRATAAALV